MLGLLFNSYLSRLFDYNKVQYLQFNIWYVGHMFTLILFFFVWSGSILILNLFCEKDPPHGFVFGSSRVLQSLHYTIIYNCCAAIMHVHCTGTQLTDPGGENIFLLYYGCSHAQVTWKTSRDIEYIYMLLCHCCVVQIFGP